MEWWLRGQGQLGQGLTEVSGKTAWIECSAKRFRYAWIELPRGTNTNRETHTHRYSHTYSSNWHTHTHNQTLLQSRSTKQIHSAQRQQQSSLSVSVSVILSHISAISASQFADFRVHLFRFSGFFSRCGLQIVVSTWLQLDMLLVLPCTLHNSLSFVFLAKFAYLNQAKFVSNCNAFFRDFSVILS